MTRFLIRHRRGASEAAHTGLVAAALAVCFLLRFDFAPPREEWALFAAALPFTLSVKLVVFRAFGLRDLAWRYLGFEDLRRLVSASAAASALSALAVRAALGSAFPRSIYALDLVVATAALAAARAMARISLDGTWWGTRVRTRARAGPGAGQAALKTSPRRVLIYGAGHAGLRVLAELRAHPESGYLAAGFVDDNPGKRGLWLNGLRVVGCGAEIAGMVRALRIEEIWLAIPSAPGDALTRIVECCQQARVTAKKIPALAQLVGDRALTGQLREVLIEDLLGRAPVHLDLEPVRQQIANRTVLVTGAGGSIGSELCRQIAALGPNRLVGVDWGETALYEIDREMRERFPRLPFSAEIGNIRDRGRLEEIFGKHKPAAVYHAAAYKHVPMMEAHPLEAVANNVFGTRQVLQASIAHQAEVFVLVSSDKAVRPANIMGATKRVAELVCVAQAAAGRARDGTAGTRVLAVRFGNVLASSGSVIPLFQRQIAAGGPVTVTHPDVERYFMTIPEAAQLVMRAAAMAEGGEIFLLEMGAPVRIESLARKMVLLSGLRPDHDVRIEFSGLRPGEKLHEELSALGESSAATTHGQIRQLRGGVPGAEALQAGLEELSRRIEARDEAGVVRALRNLVPDYHPSAALLNTLLAGGDLDIGEGEENRKSPASLAAAG